MSLTAFVTSDKRYKFERQLGQPLKPPTLWWTTVMSTGPHQSTSSALISLAGTWCRTQVWQGKEGFVRFPFDDFHRRLGKTNTVLPLRLPPTTGTDVAAQG
jgi:hypothetical protein